MSTYYWIAKTTSNFNNSANWSLTNGGTGGAGIPGAADNIVFNQFGIGSCNIDTDLSCLSFSTQFGYTGTIDDGGHTISVYDNIDIINDWGVLTSTGTWRVLDNATLVNAHSANRFSILEINTGITVTATGKIWCSKLSMGELCTISGVDGGLGINAKADYFIFQPASATIEVPVDILITANRIVGALNIVGNLHIYTLGSPTLTLAGNIVCSNLYFDGSVYRADSLIPQLNTGSFNITTGVIVGGGIVSTATDIGLFDISAFDPDAYSPLLHLKSDKNVFQDRACQFVAADKSWLQRPLANVTGLAPGSDDCICTFWVWADSLVNGQTLFKFGAGANTLPGYWIWVDGAGRINAQLAVGGGTSRITTYTDALGRITTSAWYHIGVYYDRDDKCHIFVNGVDCVTSQATPDISTNAGVITPTLNLFAGTASESTGWHDGRMDSLMFFKAPDLSGVALDILSWAYNSGNGRLCSDISDAQKTAWGAVSGWELGEQSGTRYDSWGTNHLSQAFSPIIAPPMYGTELLPNGGFETLGGGADVFGTWVEVAGNGAIAATTIASEVHTTTAAKLTAGTTASAGITYTRSVTRSANYRLSYWTRGDGVNNIRHYINDATNSVPIVAVVGSGVTGTDYRLITIDFTAPATCDSIGITFFSPIVGSGGIGFVDDVSLKQITTSAVNNGGFEDWTVPSPANVVTNSGFETRTGRTWTNFVAADKSSLTVADNAALDLGTGDFFITASVKKASIGIAHTVLAKYQDGANYWLLEIFSTNYVRFLAFVGGVNKVDIRCSSIPLTSTTTPYHIAILVDRSDSANNRIYINGTAATLGTNNVSANNIDNTGAIYVGSFNGATGYFDGYISQVGIGKPADASAAAVQTAASVTSYNGGVGKYYEEIAAADRTTLNLTSYWNLIQTTGTRSDSINTNHLSEVFANIIQPAVYGSELITNGGFETYTGTQDDGTTDAFTGHAVNGTNATNLVEATATCHGGTNAVKVTTDAGATPYIGCIASVNQNTSCRLSMWVRGDGTVAPRIAVYNLTTPGYIVISTTTGITGTNWTLFVYDFTVPSGCSSLMIQCQCSAAAGVVYFDDVSLKQITTAALNNGGFEDWTVPSAAELVVNGNFTGGITGWSNETVTYPWDTFEVGAGDTLRVACDGTAPPATCIVYSTAFPVVSGGVYRIRYTGTRTSGSLKVAVAGSSDGSNNLGYLVTHTGTTTPPVDTYFTATGTDASAYLLFYATNTAASDWLIDSVSITQVPSNATTWTEELSGTSRVVNESVAPYYGSYACRLDVDGESTPYGSHVGVSQNILTVGKLYSYGFYGKSSTTGKSLKVTSGSVENVVSLGTDYAAINGTIRANTVRFMISRNASVSSSVYLDSITLAAAEINSVSDANLFIGWTNHAVYAWDTAEWTANGLHLLLNGDGTPSLCVISSPLTLTIGRVYRLRFDVTVNSGSFIYRVENTPVGDVGVDISGVLSTSGSVDRYFVATTTSKVIDFFSANSSATNVTIDSVSIVQVPSNANTWTESVAGTSLIYREDTIVNGGSHALALQVDASNSSADVTLPSLLTNGKLYTYTVYAKASTDAVPTAYIHIENASSNRAVYALSTSYAAFNSTIRINGTLNLQIGRWTNCASKTIYLDSVTLTAAEILAAPGIARGAAQDNNFSTQLNGTSQYYSYTGTAFDPGTGGFAVGASVYLDKTPTTTAEIISGGYQSNDYAVFRAFVNPTGTITVVFNDGVGAHGSVASVRTLLPGVWYTVVVNADRAGNITLVVNNEVWSTLAISAQTGSAAFGNLYISRYSGANAYFFPGRIDNAFYANRLLTTDEITWLHNNGEWRQWEELGVVGTDGENLTSSVVKGFWEFDNINALGNDSTTNNNDLTPVGSPTQTYGINYYKGVVSAWTSTYGANSAVQSVLAKRPIYVSESLNGYQTVQFDGTDDYMTSAFGLTQPYTIFLVGKANAVNKTMIDGLTGASAITRTADDKYGINAGTLLSTVAAAETDFNLLTAVFNGANSALYLDGVKAEGGSGAGNAGGLTLGADQTLSSYMSGNIAEIIVYDGVLSELEIDIIEHYLASKYYLGYDMTGLGAVVFDTGYFNFTGDFDFGDYTISSSSTVTFSGGDDQDITGTTDYLLPNIHINKSGGTLTFTTNILCGDLIIEDGNVDVDSKTFICNGVCFISDGVTLENVDGTIWNVVGNVEWVGLDLSTTSGVWYMNGLSLVKFIDCQLEYCNANGGNKGYGIRGASGDYNYHIDFLASEHIVKAISSEPYIFGSTTIATGGDPQSTGGTTTTSIDVDKYDGKFLEVEN